MAKEPYKGCIWVANVMGARPYIDYAKTQAEKIAYNQNFKAEPGELWFTEQEKLRYQNQSGFIYIEPCVKGTFSGNKDWGFQKWQKVVEALPEFRFVQGLAPFQGKILRGAKAVPTKTFRDAASLLLHADLFVGTDGGLHHAAAALGKRAVVVWGGLVSPRILGYDTHTNLHSGTRSCGNYKACEHCKEALNWVTVDMVIDAIRSVAKQGQAGAVQEGDRLCT